MFKRHSIHVLHNQSWHTIKFNSGQFSELPTELSTVSILESIGLPADLPTISIVVGSLICMAEFPCVAHGQPTPLPTELPIFTSTRAELVEVLPARL